MNENPKVNILLVDDEPSNLLALTAALECLGQNLFEAASGKEALRQVLEKDFAVILLDVQMPDLNGIETAVAIRQRERSRTIPIIFLTGVVKSAEMVFQGYSAGAVDYLMKPIIAEVLRAKVEVFVDLAIARVKLQEEIAERVRIAAEISRLNTALEQKNTDLVAANADLETFSYSVSHDLQAPLRHIQGYISFLQSTAAPKLDDEERRHLDTIKFSAQRMAQLIDDLLAFCRTGRNELRRQRVDMNQLTREALRLLQPDILHRKIVWNVGHLPEVDGDTSLLRQVWLNLIANAVKYSRPRDPAKIEIGAETVDNEIVFHVRDNGIGFKMDYAGKLFGVFQRLHADDQFEGTGIGLANVRRIIQRHGGRTWAEGEENVGATFYFSLPVA